MHLILHLRGVIFGRSLKDASWLSSANFYFLNNSKIHCWVVKPFLKLHWKFEKKVQIIQVFSWIQVSPIFSKYMVENFLTVRNLLMFTRFLCTGVILASFSKGDNMDQAINLFGLVKTKSVKKSELPCI